MTSCPFLTAQRIPRPCCPPPLPSAGVGSSGLLTSHVSVPWHRDSRAPVVRGESSAQTGWVLGGGRGSRRSVDTLSPTCALPPTGSTVVCEAKLHGSGRLTCQLGIIPILTRPSILQPSVPGTQQGFPDYGCDHQGAGSTPLTIKPRKRQDFLRNHCAQPGNQAPTDRSGITKQTLSVRFREREGRLPTPPRTVLQPPQLAPAQTPAEPASVSSAAGLRPPCPPGPFSTPFPFISSWRFSL